jgi:hypothetical protein
VSVKAYSRHSEAVPILYMTDLSNEIIDHGPDLWIHGHTHSSFDYALGKTRVIVNPYGYKDVEVTPRYDKKLMLEL